jgi:hypothetical protein
VTARATYDLGMPPLAPDARIRFFADLRPADSYPYDLEREGRGVVEVVALAIAEAPAMTNGEPSTLYFVLELDREAWLVDDWSADGLDDALARIEEFPHSKWEAVKLADGEAQSFVVGRLNALPNR